MSAQYQAAAAQLDPENKLLWRMNRRRLEAEAVRDALFAAAGTLDTTMGGTLLPTANRAYVTSTANVNPVVYDSPRRSIYLPVVRSALYEVFTAFDFAEPSVMSGKRDSTIVASQALFMMNSSLVLEQSRALAKTLLAQPGTDAGRLETLYLRAYGRPPTTAEQDRAAGYLNRYQQAAVANGIAAADVPTRVWTSLCRAAFSANEFLFVD